jgi:peptidoglycan/LPS O-acetylase OafA/YrhL
MSTKPFYPAIQGLRALSIIAVIVFHFQSNWLIGGYVGVDLFFVISGFLITSMIERDLGTGSFSIASFYKNRVARLLPNLFAMIVATIIIGYLVLRPYDFFQYAKSLQFSAIYLTNMVFAKQQGYFDMSRDVKPLLHTWSLSIEEQFYVLFPLLMILLFKFRKYRLLALMMLAIASFAMRWRYTQQELPSEGFFSFFGRVWEFIVGAAIVYLPQAWRTKLAQQPAIFWLGMCVIAVSLIGLDEGLPYSGLLLLAPCLATALIIIQNESLLATQWLGARSLVFIGGMSYSLYLWHWPLMVWFHQSDFAFSSDLQNLLLVITTIAISYLAWRYIEEPFRQNKHKYSGKVIAVTVTFFGLFCASAGGYIYAQSGMEFRFPNYTVVAKNLASFNFKAQTGITLTALPQCSSDASASAIIQNCAFGDLQAKQRFLVLGDSHAGSWYPAFDAAAQREHWQGTQVSLPGCPPLLGIQSWDGGKNICRAHFDERLKEILAAQSFQKVFLVAFWSMYSEGESRRPHHFISNTTTTSHDASASKQVMATHLKETIRYLNARGIEVVIVHTVPTLPKRIQDLPDDYSQARTDVDARHRFMKETIDPAQTAGSLSTLDAASVLCTQAICPTRVNGYVMYSDNNHISLATATHLIPLVQSALK